MSNLLDNLNREQLQAVTQTEGPLLIVAGAGTGKTTVITRRIAYLVQQKLAQPQEILALTFTEKAAGEMEDRTLQLLPIGNYDLWISTFHSFCERVLKQHAIHIGLPYEFKLLNDTAQWMLVYKNLDRFSLDYYRPVGTPHKFIDALLRHFSKCKDELIAPEDYVRYAEELRLEGGSAELLPGEERAQEIKRIEELANAYHVYQRLLLENESLDFGDLINYTLDLFKKRPNILAHYQNLFKYMMVDEFQDTNFAQYELVKLLAGKGKSNLAVVGDDDQSIYKFRGASVSNILHFKTDFPNLTQVTLVENYRSSQGILDLAYNFIKHNDPNRLEVSLGINKRLTGNTEHEGSIGVLEGTDLASELNLVIQKIQEIKKENTELNWNDFAILIRSNAAAEEVVPRLEAAGIPYTYIANTGLYKKPLIQTLISYLKLLDNYHESSALFKVMSLPKFRVEASIMSTISLFAHKKTLSLYEALRTPELVDSLPEEVQKKIVELLGLMDHHAKESHERGSSELFAYIVKDLGIPELLEPDTLDNAQTRELLDQFYKIMEVYEEDSSDRSLKGFLANLDLELRAGNEGVIKFDPNSGPESLKVLTIHASKGLEFENVFLVNMVDQRMPTRQKKDQIEIPTALIKDILPEGDFHLQEERRLFYVAVTRAKRRLYFSWAKDYGGAREKKASVFLVEAGLLPSEATRKATGKVVFSEKPSKAPKNTVYQELPTRFSFTDISTFGKCPLEYKYRSYLKLPLPGAAQLSFGVTMHRVFQGYFEQYLRDIENSQIDLFGKVTTPPLPGIEALETLYLDSWVDEWYASKRQKQEYLEKGKTMLKTFYAATLEEKPNPKYLEKAFKLKVGGYDFVGKIDRADTTPNGLAIIDYKTGKVPKTKNKGDIDQLRVYQWAAQEFLGEKVASLSYWYVEENVKKEESLATGDELITFQEKILAQIHEIIEAIKYDSFAELHEAASEHICQFEGFE